MSVLQPSEKCFLNVREMAELCQLSRSRFYDLMEAGVFPKPAQHPSSRRPMFDRDLREKCLEIRRTGIGLNGLPVLFNRKPSRREAPKARRKPGDSTPPDHGSLLDALKGLGLTTTAPAVGEAVAALYPDGLAGVETGDVVRKVFLFLQARKK